LLLQGWLARTAARRHASIDALPQFPYLRWGQHSNFSYSAAPALAAQGAGDDAPGDGLGGALFAFGLSAARLCVPVLF
jgi:hypothetical protein